MLKALKKISFQAIFYSLVAHVCVLAILLLIRLSSEPAKTTEIYIQLPPPPLPQAEPQLPPEEPVVDNAVPTVDIPESVEDVPVPNDVVALDSVQTDSVQKFDRTSFFTTSPTLSYKQPLETFEPDSSDTVLFHLGGPQFADFRDSLQFNINPGPLDDRVNRELYQKNMGHTPTLPIGQAVGQGAKYLSDYFNKKKEQKPVHLDFVPSETEIQVLQRIWETSSATDVEIYAALDSSIKMTAADLTIVMQKLEDKGLVKKEIISPQNLFSFPLGQVEMSAKNRRNRVYRYESRISEDEIVRYLQAVLYETEYGRQNLSDSTRAKRSAGLRDKIMRLLEDKG